MADRHQPKNERMNRRGAFLGGIWHCDCEPRMPAEKFQTKNGGKNHGRWFFTCQKPQPKRCPFFIWADDAKIREESAVLNNSRSEPHAAAAPQTPKKSTAYTQPPTPLSKPRLESVSAKRSYLDINDSQSTIDVEPEDSFGWSSSGDEDLAAIAEVVSKEEPDTPRKSARTTMFDSPGKRDHDETKPSSDSTGPSWPLSDDVFLTPSTSTKSTGMRSPLSIDPRPAQPLYRQQQQQSSVHSNLTSEALKILGPAHISQAIEQELVQMLDRYELRTQGIIRGRDITRLAVQSKEKKIAELQARITGLEADRETTRTVIAHLKQDMVTSPKRPRRPQMSPSRSDV